MEEAFNLVKTKAYNMKSKHFFLFLILSGLGSQSIFAQTSSPEQILVEMENVSGIGPFLSGMTTVGNRDDESHPYFKAYPVPLDLPENMEGYKQYHIIPNFIQFVFQSVKNGKLDESNWKGLQARYKEEEVISNLTEAEIRCFIRLASREDETGNIDIWVDMNGNDIVEDEEIHHYPASLKNSKALFSDEKLIEASYQKYQNGKIIDYKVHLNLNPFAYPNNILYNFSEHKKGEVKTNNGVFDIYLSNGFLSDYFVKEQLNVFFHDDPRDLNEIPYEEKQYLQYQEVVFINGEKYKIGRANSDGTQLTLDKYPDDKEWIGTQVGAKAVPIESLTLDSIPYNLYNGKITMLDFWGSWCGPCVSEIPFLKDAASFFEGDQFELVGIVYDTRKTVESFISKNDIFWKQVMHKYDKSDSIDLSQAYGISGYPTTFLIDKDDQIVIKNKGLRSYELYKTLSKHLQKDPNEFLDFITSGDFNLIVDSSDLKISSPYLTLDDSNDKLYAYLRGKTYQRGLNFNGSNDNINITLNYFDENRLPIKKTYNITKADIQEGIFTIKL